MTIRQIIVASLYSVSLVVNAQEYALKHYDATDGCPNSLVVGIAQDSTGYLYVGYSDKGVFKYDGYSFEQLNGIEGSQGIIELYSDSKGHIWVGCSKGVYHVKGDSMTAVAGLSDFFMRSFYEAPNGTLYLGSETGQLIKIEHQQITELKKANGLRIGEITGKGDEIWFVGGDNHIYHYSSHGIEQIKYCNDNEKNTPWSIEFDMDGNLICSSLADIKLLKNNKFSNWEESKKLLNPFSNNILRDSRNRLWFLHLDAISVLDNNEVKHFPNNNFKGLALVSIFEDHNQDIWLGTTKGLIRIQNEHCILNPFNMIAGFMVKTIFQDSQNRIWTGSVMDGLVFWKNNHLNKIKIPVNNTIFYCFHEDKNQNIWIGTDNGILIYKNDGSINHINNNDPHIGNIIYSLTRIGDELWGSGRNGLFKIENNGFTNIKANSIYSGTNTTNSLILTSNDSSGRMWVLADEGILIRKNGMFEELVIDSCRFKHGYFGMVEHPKNVFWLATKENGLLKIDLNTRSAVYHTIFNGNEIKRLGSITTDSQNNLLCGTNQGIIKIAVNDKGQIQKTTVYNRSNGLIDEECLFKVLLSDHHGKIWYGSGMGLICFDPSSTTYKSKTIPTNIAIEEKGLSDAGINHFAFNQPLTIHTTGILYANPMDIRYSYFLSGQDNEWSPAGNKRTLFLKGIKPGNYTLKVRTSLVGNLNLQGSTQISFTIVEPYWKKSWFIALVIFFSIAALVGTLTALILLLKKEQFKREERKRKEIEMELKFLRSQMNPHFIFNSINSIQSLILANEIDKSLNYLNDFGRMIRRTLNYSEKETVTIKEEIEFLQEYIGLEKLRFKDKINVNLIIDEKLDVAYDRIPPMLIQPFAENAIKHGLLPKNAPGELNITFKAEGDKLKCIIEDDGVGRDFHLNSNKDLKHESKGIRLIHDRLQMLKQKAAVEKDFILTIEDLHDNNNRSTGTRVELLIPIL